MTTRIRPGAGTATVLAVSWFSLLSLLTTSQASAHTETDLVAIPAGAVATVTLRPTHGCDGSPTVEVAIRAPLADATAGDVAGWTAAVTPDGQGNTVLEWTGGPLPADQDGAFPVTFTAPDTAGELLVFPAVQVCENGEELSWIDGDPDAEYPAPRLLVLPAGSEPAASIDDVAPDAPGRDQLATVIDVDNPAVTTSTTTAPTAGTDDATTATTATTTTVGVATDDESDDGSAGSSRSATVLIAVAALVVAAAVGGAVITRGRRSTGEG